MRDSEIYRIKFYRQAWYVVWREGGETKRQALRTTDRGQADRNFQEFLRQKNLTGGTVSDILELWAKAKEDLSSIDNAKRKFKPIKNYFGTLLPDQITRELCIEYSKKRDVSNTTVRNELAVLRSAVNWHNPKNNAIFELPPTDPPKDHYLTQTEYAAFLDACTAPHLRLFTLTALHTGARSNAVLDLTWDRVDLDKRLINLAKGNHKNKRRSIVPINDTLFNALEESRRGRTTDYVIEYGGKNVVSVRKGFGMTAKKAGIEASPHVLRHTAAVVMAESGIPLQEISQYLGHVGQNTTDRIYAKYSPTYLKSASEALHKWHVEALKGSKEL